MVTKSHLKSPILIPAVALLLLAAAIAVGYQVVSRHRPRQARWATIRPPRRPISPPDTTASA